MACVTIARVNTSIFLSRIVSSVSKLPRWRSTHSLYGAHGMWVQVRRLPYPVNGVGGAEFGAACYQWARGMFEGIDRQSEDCLQAMILPHPHRTKQCLQLNIWVPSNATTARITPLAVMLWVHGGGFLAGPLFHLVQSVNPSPALHRRSYQSLIGVGHEQGAQARQIRTLGKGPTMMAASWQQEA